MSPIARYWICSSACVVSWRSHSLNFRVGTQQPLHTDAVHFSSIPQRSMCGVWVALEDISPESGPVQLVLGSHCR
ncbi:phytanoyl-CoA dioxygenase family protein [Burkholderia multivorans]|uniref:phytanoyl-CoA dioxygenase family protein n=1 Tax=Burkholderia multivorans TaxID=87883 RepID=UPI001C2380E7|nr:phytanoyl-CoA dioxygenase family protein [Burkholderia multivorans]